MAWMLAAELRPSPLRYLDWSWLTESAPQKMTALASQLRGELMETSWACARGWRPISNNSVMPVLASSTRAVVISLRTDTDIPLQPFLHLSNLGGARACRL